MAGQPEQAQRQEVGQASQSWVRNPALPPPSYVAPCEGAPRSWKASQRVLEEQQT